jgi:hypothetical protein
LTDAMSSNAILGCVVPGLTGTVRAYRQFLDDIEH